MQIVNNIEQQSSEWFALRELKMTASHAQAIGSNGKGLITYIKNLLCDYYSSAEKVRISNKDTERGNELEALARFSYEAINKVQVEQVAFVLHNAYVGCSPDGLVGKDGLIEIKCPNDINYFELLLDFKIKPEYMWQMQMQMQITGCKWCDYVCYNPNFKKDILIQRVYADDDKHSKLQEGYKAGEKLITDYINIVKELESK